MQERSIVLLSGGLDSALSLVLAREQGEVCLALTFDYGHRSANKEINAARMIADHYDITHQVVTVDFFKNFQSNPLLNQNKKLPELKTSELDDATKTKESAKSVWVPNRNGIFMNIAAGIAEACKINTIYTGFNIEEAATFPDNSQEFIDAMNQSLKYSTLNHVVAKSPTVQMTKEKIVKTMIKYDFPFPMLWSCYDNFDVMCGKCESCLRLKRGLKKNGILEQFGEMFVNVWG